MPAATESRIDPLEVVEAQRIANEAEEKVRAGMADQDHLHRVLLNRIAAETGYCVPPTAGVRAMLRVWQKALEQ